MMAGTAAAAAADDIYPYLLKFLRRGLRAGAHSIIEAGGDICGCVWNGGLRLLGLVVGEMQGDGVDLNVILVSFECWRYGDESRFVSVYFCNEPV